MNEKQKIINDIIEKIIDKYGDDDRGCYAGRGLGSAWLSPAAIIEMLKDMMED